MTAIYKTGTVSVNNGSNIVTGNGTSFIDVANVQEGDLFTLDGQKFYEIYEVDTNTQIKIRNLVTGATFAETNVVAGSFAIIRNFTSQTSAEIAGKVLAVQQKWMNREEEMTDWFYTANDWATVTSINGDELNVMTPNGINNLLGSSAQQDVYSGTYTGNSPDTILRQGDFGFGSASQSPVNFLPDNTHFPNSLGRDGDGAGGYPIFGWASSILNMRYNNARQSQVGISNGGLPQIAFRTMTSNDTWSGPYHLFGEHNSVNITEKGWGAASTPLIADADTLNETFIGRSSSANPTANMPTDFGSWNNSVLIHLQGANNAYSGQIAISAGGDIGVRGENGNIQNAWNEVFTSKNTNLDEFIGNGVNDVICEKGRPYSATTAIFYFDLCGTISPTSISAVGSPTYRIVDTWNANIIASGIPHASLTFQSTSSHKVGRVAIGGLAGMTKDAHLELQIEVANTGLKFNF